MTEYEDFNPLKFERVRTEGKRVVKRGYEDKLTEQIVQSGQKLTALSY